MFWQKNSRVCFDKKMISQSYRVYESEVCGPVAGFQVQVTSSLRLGVRRGLYRGLAPSAGDSLARRRQKSEIGVASATAPRRHEFPRRKRNGARSMIFSRRPSSPRFSGVVKVAARSKSTTSGTCRSLPATYNLAIAQPQPAQIPAQ